MMKAGNYIFDGRKSSPLTLHGEDGWVSLSGSSEEAGELGTLQAYRLVPYLYRGVDLRAKAVSSMPWGLYRVRDGVDVSSDLAYRGILRGARMRLYLTEAALCLYGAAYWLKERNQMGRNLSLRWVLPTSIQPMYSPAQGLDRFQRIVSMDSPGAGQVHSLGMDEVCYFWLPNLGAEVGPGMAPARVALAAAGVLHALDEFVEGFFKRGATRLTLLTVDGNPGRDELERLEIWWRRMVSGVRRAWQSVAVRSSVKPVVIGDGLQDTVNDTLTCKV